MDDKGLAERIFEGHMARSQFEEELDERIGNEAHKYGLYESIWFDEYDASVELGAVKPDFRLDAETQAWLWEQGFYRCWLNHTDNMQTYYAKAIGGNPAVVGYRYPQPEYALERGRPSS